MENRRPSPPRKGTGPRRHDGPKNRTGTGGGGWYRDDSRNGGPVRPGGQRFGGRADGSSRDGNYSRSGGKYPPSRPGGRGSKPVKSWDRQPHVKITSDLQITDGKHQGKLLENSASPNMKPTPSRLREMLFKLIPPRKVRASRFLDICAGSGLIGLEAISRGAMLATFVERSARMCSWIKKNVEQLGLKSGHAEVLETEVLHFLKQMSKRRRRWDIVFFCPPTDGTAGEMFEYLSRGTAIAPGGMLVIEHPSEMEIPISPGLLQKGRTHKMDGTTLSFFDRKPV